jgi:hypothetical protein
MTDIVQIMPAAEFAVAERVIAAGLQTFVEVGQALIAIRDGHGYQHAGYVSFEAYCRERWQISRPQAYRLMDAAQIAQVLSPIGDNTFTESQARELVPLLRTDPELIPEVWREAIETAPNGQITAAHVAEVVERHARPVPEPDSRPMRETPLLRFSQDLPTATIVSLILRVFFPDAKTALDVTYGSGNFWDGSAHVEVTAHDLDPTRAPHGVVDFTGLPYADAVCDVVLADPPHLADLSSGSIMAERFGTYPDAQLADAIQRGVREAWRVARLGIVIKVTDHVHSQRYQLESDWVRAALDGLEPYDVVHQVRSGALIDPKWGAQMSAYNNGSTFMIFRKDGPLHRPRGSLT